MSRIPLFILIAMSVPSLLEAQDGSATQRKSTEFSRKIIYFGPAQSALDVVNGKDLDESLDDFAYYISRADTTLKRLGITTEYNASIVIEVPYGENHKALVDRRIQAFGYIFFDGKRKPLVIDYVLTDLDLIDTAKDFFGIQ